MKFLFFVQSNVTIYLVKHFIEVNNIDERNIVIFYTRVSLPDIEILPGQKIDFLKVFYRKFVNVDKTHLQMFYLTWASVYKIRKFINHEIKSYFVLVVPHLIWDMKQIFSTSKKCKKVIYLEEGDMSYASEAEVQNKLATMETFTGENLRRLFSLGILFNKHPFQDRQKQHEAICLSEEAFPFPYIKKHTYLFKDVFKNDGHHFKYDYTNSVIFLLEHITWFDDSQKEDYYALFKKVLNNVKEQFGNQIYLKPHPELFKNIEREKYILTMIEECGLQAQIINDPIELIVTRFKEVRIFAHRSSLIRYCSLAGIRPYVWGMSLIPEEVRRKDTLSFKFINQHPEKVHFID